MYHFTTIYVIGKVGNPLSELGWRDNKWHDANISNLRTVVSGGIVGISQHSVLRLLNHSLHKVVVYWFLKLFLKLFQWNKWELMNYRKMNYKRWE